MKIYSVYCGELCELEVTETKKMYVASERSKAFDYKERFRKRDCFLMQRDAIADFIKKANGEIELLDDAITFIKEQIVEIHNKYSENCFNAS